MKASITLPGLVVCSFLFNCFTPCLGQGNYNAGGAYPSLLYPSPASTSSNGPYGGGSNPNMFYHLYLANRGTYTGGGSRDFRTAKFHGRCCRCGPSPAGCDCHRCTNEDIDASQDNSAAGKPPLNIVPPAQWSQSPPTNYQPQSSFLNGLKNFFNCGVLGCGGGNNYGDNNNNGGLFSGLTGLFGGSSGSSGGNGGSSGLFSGSTGLFGGGYSGNNGGGAVPGNFLNCGLLGCGNSGNGGGNGGIFSGVTSLSG